MYIYFIYFLFIAFFAIEFEYRPFNNRVVLIALVIALGLLAGLRGTDVALDYENYLHNFEIVPFIDDPIFLTIFEPGFIAIVYIVRLLVQYDYGVVIMLVFALTSVFLKIRMFGLLTVNPFLAILIYFSNYFLLHEMTQIRIGLASALFMCGIPFLLQQKKMSFFAFVFLASLFHYSAIIYIFLAFLDSKSFNKIFYLCIIAIALVFAFLKLPLANYLTAVDGSQVSVKLDTYSELGRKGYYDEINFFNALTMANLLCCLYYIFFIPEKMLTQSRSIVFFLKTNILSIFILGLLSGVTSIAFRFSEIYNVASIFLFANLGSKLPFGKLNVFIVIAFAAAILLLNVVWSQLVGPYYIQNFSFF